MSILSFLSGAIKPLTDLVDDLFTSDEERLKAKAKIQKIENEIAEKFINYETELLKSRTQIINSEAQGQSWIQRTWRPITMLAFLVLVCLDAFGVLPFRLSADAWTLLKIGLGGYVVGRSGEKIVAKLKK